ncbi:MAG: peptidoglycan binding domain-containing protein, partial [Chloroflexi bacterium]|nr:peptidoglycan binding domain-containing protein [Chloroflexota bacterium]
MSAVARPRSTTQVPLLLAIGIATLVALAAGYQLVAQAQSTATTVAGGVRVAGLDLGGLDYSEARMRIAKLAAEREAQPVALRAGDQTYTLPKRDLGLHHDVEGAVREVQRASGSGSVFAALQSRFERLWGSHDVELKQSVDASALAAAVARLGGQIDRPARDGSLGVADGRAVVTDPAPGRRLDVERSAAAVAPVVSAPGAGDVALVVDNNVRPSLDTPALADAKASVDRYLTAPLVLEFEGKQTSIPTAELGSWLRIERHESGGSATLSVSLDEARLRDRVAKQRPTVAREPQDAKFEFRGNRYVVAKPDVAGRDLGVDATVRAARSGLESGPSRTIALVPSSPVAAKLSAAEIEGWVQLASSSTDYESAADRMHNIELASKRLAHTLIRPGEVFSLND